MWTERPRIHVWFEPWCPISGISERLAVEAQLARELSEGHVLFGRKVEAIGRRSDNDEVVFWLSDRAELAVVHLTWSRTSERLPWPWAVIYDGATSFIDQGMKVDAAGRGGEDGA